MESLTLEDNKEYLILDTIKLDGIKYLYLCEMTNNDKHSVCIRKLVDNDENVSGLDNDDEYKKALYAYVEKYKEVMKSA